MPRGTIEVEIPEPDAVEIESSGETGEVATWLLLNGERVGRVIEVHSSGCVRLETPMGVVNDLRFEFIAALNRTSGPRAQPRAS